MDLIDHTVTGEGGPPIVFVHGFGCARQDWDAQVAWFAPRRRVVAVDLRGHGATPGGAAECSIERYGADVAELMRALDLPPAVLVGHSMGCRVVTEAALQAPERAAGAILVDGSQFAPAMEPVMRARFAEPGGYAAQVAGMFTDMFTGKSDPAVRTRVVERAGALPVAVGQKMLLDLLRYDVHRFASALACLREPVLALQATYSNEKRERKTMSAGQTTPYLEMVKTALPAAQVAVVADTGHFPQLDEAAATNVLIQQFLDALA